MAKSTLKKRILKWMGNGLFIALVFLLSAYILTEAIAPSRTVDLFRFKPYVVLTNSMEPVINTQDVVVVGKADVSTLEVGDIITFHVDINQDGNQEVVTHYIYDIDDSGDDINFSTHRHFENANDITPDNWTVHEDDVLGEYRFTIAYAGFFISFIRSPFGIFALIMNGIIITSIVILIKLDKSKDASEA